MFGVNKISDYPFLAQQKDLHMSASHVFEGRPHAHRREIQPAAEIKWHKASTGRDAQSSLLRRNRSRQRGNSV